MSVVITREVVTKTPADRAFAYLTDHEYVPDWLFGVVRFKPTTGQLTGPGATYDVAVSLGITITSRVRINEWSDGRVMAFESVTGFRNSSRWEVTPTDDGGCRLAVQVTYDLPLGPAGKAIGKTIEPFINAAVNRSTADLTRNLDQLSLAD